MIKACQNKSDFRPISKTKLAELAKILNRNPDTHISKAL